MPGGTGFGRGKNSTANTSRKVMVRKAVAKVQGRAAADQKKFDAYWDKRLAPLKKSSRPKPRGK
jgi:hypothetical protein